MSMYSHYFGLSESPFSITPDPRYLYLSPRHQEALAHLLYGIEESGGFVQLTGEVGTGKTMLTRALLDQLPENADVALILNPRVTVIELLGSICDELKIAQPAGEVTVKQYVDLLSKYLLDAYSKGRRTVLLIDEAQNLSFEVIEQIRLLTNIETSKEKLLQIILVGQPELIELLDQMELRQVAQRITARYHLKPLSYPETSGYIRHRLSIAGADRPLFTAAAVSAVRWLSGGIPRLVNIICDRALLGAYASGAAQAGVLKVFKAAAEVKGGHRRRNLMKPVLVAVLLLLIAGYVIYQPELPLPPKSVNAHPPVTTVAPAKTEKTIDNKDMVDSKPVPVDLPEIVSASEPDKLSAIEKVPASEKVNESDSLNQADEKPAEKHEEPGRKAESGFVSIEKIFSEPGLDSSLKAAFSELFRLWGVSYQHARGTTGCAKASSEGLRCYFAKGNWARLKTLNRPAVVSLYDHEGKERFALIESLSSSSVQLSFSGYQVNMRMSEFVSSWSGEMIALWRPPKLKNIVLKKGVSGSDIAWLHERLRRIDGESYQLSGDQYDKQLAARIKTFQRDHYLEIDGVVGEKTMVHLLAAAAEPSVPLLTVSGEGAR